MRKTNYLMALLTLLALGGCKTSKIQIEEIDKIEFCQITSQLVDRLQNDDKLKSYFGIESETVRIYYDTLVHSGNPSFFEMEVAELRAKKENLSINETYPQVQYETTKNSKKYRTNCAFEERNRTNADLQVTFWYSKKDSFISLDAVNILEEPGYSQGYLYLIKIGSKGEIKRLKETYWEE